MVPILLSSTLSPCSRAYSLSEERSLLYNLSFISAAASLVKVTISIFFSFSCLFSISLFILSTITVVLPVPADALTRRLFFLVISNACLCAKVYMSSFCFSTGFLVSSTVYPSSVIDKKSLVFTSAKVRSVFIRVSSCPHTPLPRQ